MRKSIVHSICLMACVAAAFCSSAFSQWSGALGSTWNNPTSASISRILIDRMNQRALERRMGKKSVEPAKADTVSPAAASIEAAVRFKSSGTRLKVASIVQELGGTADEQEQLKAMLNGILDGWDRETGAAGMSNDLAFAFAGFIVMSSSAHRGQPLPPDDIVMGLRNVIAEALAEGGAGSTMGNKDKQEAYETLVIFGTLAFTGWSESVAAGDQTSASVYRQLGGENLRTVFGIDPDKISIGKDGIAIEGVQPVVRNPSPGRDALEAVQTGQLVADYEGNEVGADMKYGGKRLRISGLINSIDVEPDGRISVTYKGSANSYGMVKCYFDNSQRGSLSHLRSNDQLTAQGTVKGLGGGWDGAKAFVVLEGCVVQ